MKRLFALSMLFLFSLSAQSTEAESAPFFSPVGAWMICESGGFPAGPLASFCDGPQPQNGSEPDYLSVSLRSPQATGFIYFIDGRTLGGVEKSVSGVVQRNDMSGTTSLIVNAGLISGVVHIVEFSRVNGVFLVLDGY